MPCVQHSSLHFASIVSICVSVGVAIGLRFLHAVAVTVFVLHLLHHGLLDRALLRFPLKCTSVGGDHTVVKPNTHLSNFIFKTTSQLPHLLPDQVGDVGGLSCRGVSVCRVDLDKKKLKKREQSENCKYININWTSVCNSLDTSCH